jgi:FAD/FMN-containing dehydrogenase
MNFDDLKRSLSGDVVTRDEAHYAATRNALVWNGRKPMRFPDAIVRVASVADVQAAVRFAAAAGLRVSARGAGHQFSGIAVQEGIVLDLSALNHIEVDTDQMIASVGPTVRNGDAAQVLGAHGLAFPLGHCASVPLSGYLLGGGFGWNSGEWGVACFNVASVDVVLADGGVHRASETENPEIFWAVRGGGPEFFGVVVAYRLKLRPLPRTITTSVFTYPIEDAARVERWMHETMKVVPANVEFTFMASSAPPPLADKVSKIATGIATVFADTPEEATATLGRVAALAPSGALDIQQFIPTPFDVLYAIIGQFFPEGHRYAVDTFWSGHDNDGVLAQLAAETARAPSPRTFSLGVVLPPSALDKPMPDVAFSMAGPVFAAAYSIWDDPAADEANHAWIRLVGKVMAPTTIGAYVGEADLDRPARLADSYSQAAWTKLQMLQTKYDPRGTFRNAQSLAASLKSAA